jgi:hypothetical protein
MLFTKPIFMHDKAHKLWHFSNMENTFGSRLGLQYFGRAQVLGLLPTTQHLNSKVGTEFFSFLAFK